MKKTEVEGIIPTTRQASRNATMAAFLLYMGGLLYFLAVADWTIPVYKKLYWMWTMGKDALFIYTIYLLSPKYRHEIYPIFFFSIIRFIWEIIARTTNQDVNSIMLVDYMFYLILFITVARLIKHLRREWKRPC